MKKMQKIIILFMVTFCINLVYKTTIKYYKYKMEFSKSDKSFTFKMSLLFFILFVGAIVNTNTNGHRGIDQDVIKLEKNEPVVVKILTQIQHQN
jgi:hypothetical protein